MTETKTSGDLAWTMTFPEGTRFTDGTEHYRILGGRLHWDELNTPVAVTKATTTLLYRLVPAPESDKDKIERLTASEARLQKRVDELIDARNKAERERDQLRADLNESASQLDTANETLRSTENLAKAQAEEILKLRSYLERMTGLRDEWKAKAKASPNAKLVELAKAVVRFPEGTTYHEALARAALASLNETTTEPVSADYMLPDSPTRRTTEGYWAADDDWLTDEDGDTQDALSFDLVPEAARLGDRIRVTVEVIGS